MHVCIDMEMDVLGGMVKVSVPTPVEALLACGDPVEKKIMFYFILAFGQCCLLVIACTARHRQIVWTGVTLSQQLHSQAWPE